MTFQSDLYDLVLGVWHGIWTRPKRPYHKDMSKPWWNEKPLRQQAAIKGVVTKRQLQNKFEIQINDLNDTEVKAQ